MFFSSCNMNQSPEHCQRVEWNAMENVYAESFLIGNSVQYPCYGFRGNVCAHRNIVPTVLHTENVLVYAFASDKWCKTWVAATQNKMTVQKAVRDLTFRALSVCVCVFKLIHYELTHTRAPFRRLRRSNCQLLGITFASKCFYRSHLLWL